MKPYTIEEIIFLVKTLATPSQLLIFWTDLEQCKEHYMNEVWINIINLFQARNAQFI